MLTGKVNMMEVKYIITSEKALQNILGECHDYEYKPVCIY